MRQKVILSMLLANGVRDFAGRIPAAATISRNWAPVPPPVAQKER
jgi:hypothetical protein